MIDPAIWLTARGWTVDADGNWNPPGHVPEPGWTGGWNLAGAVWRELEAQNIALVKEMGLWQPPARRRRRR